MVSYEGYLVAIGEHAVLEIESYARVSDADWELSTLVEIECASQEVVGNRSVVASNDIGDGIGDNDRDARISHSELWDGGRGMGRPCM